MLTIDVLDPDFCFYGEALRCARRDDQPVMSRYGPVVTSYAEAQRLLKHPALVHDPRRQLNAAGADDDLIERWFASLLIFSRADDHRELRAQMFAAMDSAAFSPAFGARCTFETIGALRDDCCDFMQAVAEPVVDRLTAAICGVGVEAFRPVAAAVRDMALIHRLHLLPVLMRARDAVREVEDFLRREAQPLGKSAERLSIRALMSFVIGFTPLRLSLGTAIVALAQADDDIWDRLAVDHSFAEHVGDETIRWKPSAPIQIRFAEQAVNWRHGSLHKGDPVLLCVAQAHRDGDPDLERFDVWRRPSRPHLAFGGGPHHCIAAAASRRLLGTLLSTLAGLMAKPQVIGPIAWEQPSGVHGPTALPVRIRSRHVH